MSFLICLPYDGYTFSLQNGFNIVGANSFEYNTNEFVIPMGLLFIAFKS